MADEHHTFWDFYELDEDRSVMVGMEANLGDLLRWSSSRIL